jgi:RND superfamily putative drug exporter
VACTLLTAWTLLPALLGTLGDRVNRWALPKGFRPASTYTLDPAHPSGAARWAHMVLAHPWLAIPAAAVLLLFAFPILRMVLGIDLGIAAISDTPSGKAEVILADKFTPGLLSPVQILASHEGSGALSTADLTTIDRFTRSLAKDPRVAYAYSISTLLRQTVGEVSPQAMQQLQEDPTTASFLAQTVNVGSGSNRTIVTVVSKASIDSAEATQLVRDLRNDVIPGYTASAGPQMLVGGSTAQFDDLGEETLSKLPLVMVMVLAFSFCYLLVIFRSLLVPTKAVLLNLLATGAAFGLTSWVFAEGHLEGLFGFTSVGFIQTYLPIMVFALLFGLSMDYEVFLVGRMREQWLLTHDNDQAVVSGIAHTARPITAAALIMAAVFGCFLVADVLELKEFGFALAAAVLLDATLVRMLLVPAIMKVAGGKANWWLPKWLERILPRVRVE